MKYILLIYEQPGLRETFVNDPALMAEVETIMAELTESGEFVGGEALADPSQAKTIRPRDGVPAVTDGPFAESKEQLGGYLIVDCETPDRAADIALRWPNSRFGAMEVRPLMDTSGAEM